MKHKKECETDFTWSHCDICGQCGSFDAGNFDEDGLFGFIGFTMDDLRELELTHLDEDSIRCRKCLKLDTIKEK